MRSVSLGAGDGVSHFSIYLAWYIGTQMQVHKNLEHVTPYLAHNIESF